MRNILFQEKMSLEKEILHKRMEIEENVESQQNLKNKENKEEIRTRKNWRKKK